MSKSKKSLMVLASAVAPIIWGASAQATIGPIVTFPGGIGAFWPSSATGSAPTSAVKTDPLIFSGNGVSTGSPNNDSQVTVPEQVGSGVFSVLSQTISVGATGFNLGEVAFNMSGSPDAGTNDESLHIFQLNSTVTPASTGYTPSTAEVADILGGGTGDNFSFQGGPGGVEQFVFSNETVSLLPNTMYAIELWVDQNSGSILTLLRPSGADVAPGGAYPYTGGQAYFVSTATVDDGQTEMSTTPRGEIAGSTRDLLFALYPAGVASVVATWTGAAVNANDWATPGNWTGGTPQNAGDSALFPTGTGSLNPMLNGNRSLGTITFNGPAYTLGQGSSGTLTLDNQGTNGHIDDLFGNSTISAPMTLNSTAQIAVGQSTNTLTLSGNINGVGGILSSGDGSIAVGVGTIALTGTNTYSGGTSVTTGTVLIGAAGALPAHSAVTIGAAGKLQLGPTTGGQTLSSLTITAGGILDLGNNHFILSYGATDPASTIYTLLQTGYDNGGATAWTGAGIDSSVAALPANSANYGIGFVDGNDGVAGATVTSGQILVAYALYGDVNLDGLVNATDFAIFGANFNTAVTGWDKGDFTYTGLINATDFALLGANFGKSASGASLSLPASDFAALDAFAAANGLSLTSVPEPASLGLLTLGTLGILGRRRRSAKA